MILTEIIEEKKKEIDESKNKISQEELLVKLQKISSHRKPNFFRHSISKPHKIHLIAEVKRPRRQQE